MKPVTSTCTVLALALLSSAAPALAQTTTTNEQSPGAADNAIEANIISLADWRYDELYQNGVSAEDFIDEMEVYGATGEEIGEVEDIIIGQDGRMLAIVAEVGGFWDIGDTHVSVPFDQVEISQDRDGVIVPVTEDTVDDYGLFEDESLFDNEDEVLTGSTAETQVTANVDDVPVGPRAWRVSELIGDYARLREGDGYRNYGYINDVILRDGQVASVVVSPDVGFGARGRYAYPYYGWGGGYGWNPGSPYYNLPYTEDEVAEMEAFDPERLEVQR